MVEQPLDEWCRPWHGRRCTGAGQKWRGGGWGGGGERVMARYKLPRLQKNSGSFSALPVSLHRRDWFTSALPFAAPVQPFTVPALPFTASSQCPCVAVPASWQPRGTASGVFWAYSVRTWGGEALAGRYADFGLNWMSFSRKGCSSSMALLRGAVFVPASSGALSAPARTERWRVK